MARRHALTRGEPRRIHRFYLKVAEINSGLPVHIPTYVAKGCTGEGKRMWLSSTIHGDELNPIR
jgi:predicted deacylase